MSLRFDFDKDVLKNALLSYGENALADKIDSLIPEQMKIIGNLAAKHIGQHHLVAKTIALGAVDFFEGESRHLKKKKRDLSFYKKSNSPVESKKQAK